MRKPAATLVCVFICLSISLCAFAQTQRLKMSTTTSTENSGLLAVLLPPFEKARDCRVDVIAVGTGKALKLAENGDVDVVFVHSRPAEDKFVAAGFGVERADVMYNDFVILGPPEDPAGLVGSGSLPEVFKKISGGKAAFVSRGDDSGTHKKEKSLWKLSGIEPGGKWYVEAGQGMGAVLKMADEKRAYTMADRGTYIAFADKVSLAVIFEGGMELSNPYGIIAVNPERHPHIDIKLARKFIAFVTGEEGQRIIGEFKVGGQQLFHPDAR